MEQSPLEIVKHLSIPFWMLLLAGCAARAEIYTLDHPPPPHVQIPAGHMPPPGECRVWFPDRPPGQQPPPGPCHELRYRVPPGGYLVRG